MSKEKSPETEQQEKERLKLKEQEVKNVFEAKSLVPDQQNRMKGTEPARD